MRQGPEEQDVSRPIAVIELPYNGSLGINKSQYILTFDEVEEPTERKYVP